MWSVIIFVAWVIGYRALWNYEHWREFIIVEGQVKDGLTRVKIREFQVPPKNWTEWVDLPEGAPRGLAVKFLPFEVNAVSRFAVIYDDGTEDNLPGDVGVIPKKVVSACAWNGSGKTATAQFFTWEKR